MNNKILIFAKTTERGKEFLEELVGEMKYKDVLRVVKNINDMYAELKNGTIYKVVSASDSSRGYKCNKAYVQYGIGKHFIDNIIRPMLILSDLPEDEQIEQF